MNPLRWLRARFAPQREHPAPAEEPVQMYTAEQLQYYAEVVHQERMNQLHGQVRGKKFSPLLMDFGEGRCHATKQINGVKQRVQVRCPWERHEH